MAQRCNLGNHDSCVACKAHIDPASDHHHVHRRNGAYEVLCVECTVCTIYAATLLLTAVAEAGEPTQFARIRELADRGQIIIAIGRPLWPN